MLIYILINIIRFILIGNNKTILSQLHFLQFAPMESIEAKPYQGGYQRTETLGTALDYAIVGVYFRGPNMALVLPF